VRYSFIQQQEGRFSVSALCRALRVSRSGYSAWKRRRPSRRAKEEQSLLIEIRAAHQESKGTYGSPRIHRDLLAREFTCSENRVARIMRKYDITARPLRQYVTTTDSNHPLPVAPNRLERKFTAEEPNTHWSADITYLRTGEGWLYLAVVLDLYSRRVIGWSMRDTLDRSLPLAARESALSQRNPEAGLICHSDRGSQYASGDYQTLLTEAGAVCSMSRKGNCYDNAKGNCYDNAPVESFFASLKRELIHRQTFATRMMLGVPCSNGSRSATTASAAIRVWDTSAPISSNSNTHRK